MIQLSNISLLTAADIDLLPFPILAVLLILGGFALFKSSVALAILLLILSGIWFYFWYIENEMRKEGAILTIRMNSGQNLHFSFEDKVFLLKVVEVLEKIIIDGGNNSQTTIDIKACNIIDSDLFSNINT